MHSTAPSSAPRGGVSLSTQPHQPETQWVGGGGPAARLRGPVQGFTPARPLFGSPGGVTTEGASLLEHPRRQLLLAYVRERGAVGPREAARAAGIPPTTALHHLTLLKRRGLVLETRTGTRILFHAPQQAPVLRFPGWSILHAWIAEHPDQRQKAILAAMQEHGWPRSTTQHRLRLLLVADLVELNQRTYRTRAAYPQHDRPLLSSDPNKEPPHAVHGLHRPGLPKR
jgi:hypothetical protein